MSPEALPLALRVLVALAAGYCAGLLHFRTLAWVAERLVAGRLSAVGLQVARMAALTIFLWLCALAGDAVLIAGAAGVMLGRTRALRGVR
jgi:hypothetical protein